MRFVLCLLLAAMASGSAFAAKQSMQTMNLSQAQAAAAKGDQAAAAAVGTTIDQQTCLNGCSSRGYDKRNCDAACRPGFCHPHAETAYCVAE